MKDKVTLSAHAVEMYRRLLESDEESSSFWEYEIERTLAGQPSPVSDFVVYSGMLKNFLLGINLFSSPYMQSLSGDVLENMFHAKERLGLDPILSNVKVEKELFGAKVYHSLDAITTRGLEFIYPSKNKTYIDLSLNVRWKIGCLLVGATVCHVHLLKIKERQGEFFVDQISSSEMHLSDYDYELIPNLINGLHEYARTVSETRDMLQS
jgi:hypothetical protein